MNKVITINLNGNAFQLEEEGYSRLQEYLRIAGGHLAEDPDKDEIMSDIEQAIADKCRKYITANKNIVTDREIDDIIKEMGPVKSSTENHEHENEETEKNSADRPKKLFRSSDDAILGGVASGLGAYLGIDKVWVRLLFIIVTIPGGYGALFYIILWLLVPEAKTSADKISMRGDKINLASLEKTVKEKVQEIKNSDDVIIRKTAGFAGFLKRFFRGSGKVIYFCVKFLVRTIGFFWLLAFAIAAIGLTAGVVAVALNINTLNVDMPIRAILSGWEFYLSLFTVYFLALVPLLFLMFIGQTIMLFRNAFNKAISLGLLAVWIVSIIFGGALALRLAPKIANGINDSPQFKTITRTYDIKNFQSVSVQDMNTVSVVQGKEFKVTATGREYFLDNLTVANNNGVLKIDSNDKFRLCLFCFHPHDTRVEVIMPIIASLSASDASTLTADNISGKDLEISISDASRITLLGTDWKTVIGKVSDASRLELQGIANDLILDIKDASRFQGSNFVVKNATITAHDASRAEINVTKTLKATLSDVSRVYYLGEPKIESNLSDFSRISPVVEEE